MLLWSCLFWETEDKQWKLSGRTLSVSDIACVVSVSAGLVSEQKKTVERDFRFWPRENWNENQKMCCSSFFAPEPHRNACYVGHKRHLISYLQRLRKISFQLPYKLCIFTFPLVLGCPLERAFAVLSFIKNFSSQLALRNRSVHPHATVTHSKKRPNFLILIGWRKLLLFVILPYKSDSSFNIKNVAIISYSTAIRRVSKLLFL